MAGKQGSVIVIVGGAGFLGQHIVRELQLLSEFDEIRIFDVKRYENQLGFGETNKLVSIVGDVLDYKALETALRDATVVLHTAGVVDVSVFPDMEKLQRVNVQGTRNVVEACLSVGVPYLIYTSTVDVAIGHDDIRNGDEHIAIPDRLLYAGYGRTKREAELLVLAANQKPLSGVDERLNTLCLRPSCMYGEEDPYYIPTILRTVKQQGGTFMRVGNGTAIFQTMYAGNCAWAHICALQAMRKDHKVAGAAYFINDDTPRKSAFDLAVPFLTPHGYKLSKLAIPYGLVYVLFWMMEVFLKILRPLRHINMKTSLASIIYINKTFYFKRALAEKKLTYRPKYSYEESIEKSLQYYNRLDRVKST